MGHSIYVIINRKKMVEQLVFVAYLTLHVSLLQIISVRRAFLPSAARKKASICVVMNIVNPV